MDEVAPERQLEVVRLTVEAPTGLCARRAPAMVARGAGGILNLASVAAFAGRGDNVTALCPGPVPTEIFGSRNDAQTHPVDRMPRLFWREASQLAEAGEAGDPRVFVGLSNRLAALGAEVMPQSRRVLTVLSKRFTEPSKPNAARRL